MLLLVDTEKERKGPMNVFSSSLIINLTFHRAVRINTILKDTQIKRLFFVEVFVSLKPKETVH